MLLHPVYAISRSLCSILFQGTTSTHPWFKRKVLRTFSTFLYIYIYKVYILGTWKLSHKDEDRGRESLLASEHHVGSSRQWTMVRKWNKRNTNYKEESKTLSMDDIICCTENQKGKPTAANEGKKSLSCTPQWSSRIWNLKKAMPFTIPLQNWGALVEM